MNPLTMSDAFRLDPDLACDACGCFGAYRFETESLCADCYAGRGSCCSTEFSGAAPRAESCGKAPKPQDRSDAAGTRASEA